MSDCETFQKLYPGCYFIEQKLLTDDQCRPMCIGHSFLCHILLKHQFEILQSLYLETRKLDYSTTETRRRHGRGRIETVGGGH